MARLLMGIDVALAVAQIAGVACRRRAILQMLGHFHLALCFYLGICLEVIVGRIRLRGGGQVERRLDDGIDPFWQACYSIQNVMSRLLPVCRLTGSQWAWLNERM